MKPNCVLVVVEQNSLTRRIAQILDEADVRYVAVNNSADAWNGLCGTPEIDLVLVQFRGETFDGITFCSRVRAAHRIDQLPVLVMIDQDQAERAGEVLEAGANDVVLVPFESQELRLKANLPATPLRRVDAAFSFHDEDPVPTAPPAAAQAAVETLAHGEAITPVAGQRDEHDPIFVVPMFDPHRLRFRIFADARQIRRWENDSAVTKVELDQVLTCPQCGSLPSLRKGCGCCGSAWGEPDRLIHHYACAHVAAESEFRRGDRLVCPKCLMQDLVAGSDFELAGGCCVCRECKAILNQPENVCQCLSCLHRFPIDEATVESIMGYEIPRSSMVPAHSAGESDSQPPQQSPSRRRSHHSNGVGVSPVH